MQLYIAFMDMCKVNLNHSSYSVCRERRELKKTPMIYGYPNSNDLSSCSLAMNMIIWDRRIYIYIGAFR